KDNLSKTCGKCHAGMTGQVANGQIHSGRRPSLEHFAVMVVRRFYVLLIAFVIGFMLFHNGIDWARKLRQHYRAHAAVGKTMRMTVNERVQHFILLLSFSVLAYTGFALKYPETWWSAPFAGHGEWRRLGHRIAAVVFCAFLIYHTIYLLATKRGREKIKALWLKGSDFVQLWETLLYNLGKRTQRPLYSRYSYVEKFEYWALVWGSIVMIVTGTLMVASDWLLSVLPKWVYDVVAAVHYYEAVLACLAIIVWHGYSTMFDPDEYPMKLTWLNGLPSKADKKHRRDDPEKPVDPPDQNEHGQ
ncbi:MAG: cytochrome b/b6 domain-containing protein, partial [Candidatus Omnitrophota bacterium]|nr:cytochrome b/b6 domain-containing protein [Candidatus Omnitrophota bacterium]